MSVTARDSLADLEKHRLRLEETITQLRSALKHWQTWDIEYEALKEEVQAAQEPTLKELERIRDGFEAELVDAKEIKEIFGPDHSRSQEQIINVIDRRIDYVDKSVLSLRKQLETATAKHAAASIISQPNAENEEGLPVMDIMEELDDDDNVLSYKVNRPGDSLSQVREALEKAGIKDLPPLTQKNGKESPRVSDKSNGETTLKETTKRDEPVQASRIVMESAIAEKPAKKGVSFSEDTKPAVEPKPRVSKAAKRVEEIMKTAKSQDESKTIVAPVIPEDESPEDASMRAEMLKYSMGEMSSIVGELQLEEGFATDDDDSYSDEDFDEDDDDEDDKWGRARSSAVTDAYHQRMLELEEKLGVKSRFTAQQEAKQEAANYGSDDERLGRIVINHSPAPSSTAAISAPTKSSIKERPPTEDTAKKGVRFADDLDIAPVEDQAPAAVPIQQEEAVIEPISETIVERSASSAPINDDTKSARPASRFSRFKKARGETNQSGDMPLGPFDVPARFGAPDEDPRDEPTGPDGKTIANLLVERDPVHRPMPDDGFDDTMIHTEVADEYQRMRRKFVQRQGGFLKEDENPIQPLDESEGGPPRMSRFKAARLSNQ